VARDEERRWRREHSFLTLFIGFSAISLCKLNLSNCSFWGNFVFILFYLVYFGSVSCFVVVAGVAVAVVVGQRSFKQIKPN